MYNNEKPKFTRLVLEQSNLKIGWEIPYEDVNGEDMMQALRTIMIGMTFTDNSVIDSMVSYIQNHSNKYEIHENNVEYTDYEEIIDDEK